MGFQSLKNGSSASSSAAAGTQLTVNASDVFKANDPVFMDWKTGEFINQNVVPSVAALASGPSMSSFTLEEVASVGSGVLVGSAAAVTADGTLFLLASTAIVINSTYRATVILTKLSSKGALLAKINVMPTAPNMTAYYVDGLITELSNGNILVTCSLNTIGNWAIYSPDLQLIGSGTGSPVKHIQPTDNGGALLLSGLGIELMAATGARTALVSAAITSLAMSDEVNDNGSLTSQGKNPYAPFGISAGGFGYLYLTADALYFARFNSNGTLRGAPLTVNPTISGMGATHYAVSSANGNIMWAMSAAGNPGGGGLYGIVSDTGLSVVSPTAITNHSQSYGTFRLISDASGNFLLFTFNYDSGLNDWYVNYMQPNGAAAFGGARKIGKGGNTINTSITISNVSVFKLSTGTVLIFGGTQTEYSFRYVFIDLTGNVTYAVLNNFGYGNSGVYLAGLVIDDKVYGVCSTLSDPQMLSFSISNTGQLSKTPLTIGTGTGNLSLVRVVLDASKKCFHALQSLATGATTTVVVSIDLTTKMIQSFQVSQFLLASRIVTFSKGLLCTNTNINAVAPLTQPTSGPTLTALFVKPRSTILIGVAGTDADPNDPLLINTKGTFSTSSAWRAVSQAFDHSANSPQGNAGAINSGLITLKGL